MSGLEAGGNVRNHDLVNRPTPPHRHPARITSF
jgi:hypothetical protein